MVTVQITFPLEPSPIRADLSKLLVTSFSSSMENLRHAGIPRAPDFAASDTYPEHRGRNNEQNRIFKYL